MAKSRVIGLDIGSTNVRAAEVEFGSRGPAASNPPEVLRFGEVPLPPGAVRDGEVVEPEAVTTAIKHLWRETKFSTKDVVIGVGNQRVLVRDMDLPAMPLDQIRASLPYQVQDQIPVAVEDALLDFVPTALADGQHGPVVKGLLVAATKDSVEANISAVEAAGLRVSMVDLNALALTRSLTRGAWADRTVALVDLGARITTVVIVVAGLPQFVRVLPTGGHDMTAAISSAMGVSEADAEAMKRQVGIGMSVPPDYVPAAEAVAQVGHVLVEAVRGTLSYFSMNNPNGVLDMVLLSGRGAQLPGLGQYLSSAARVSVSLATPLAATKVGSAMPKGQHLEEIQHVLGVPLGLAFGVAA
ncbi:type IV pilus assembly protein PilM [Sanguibacter suaedae]|uniref:Type IV pilus assembly protein PilM n=1 Tax=Sanguibacter suaedae TaxID=2795737 RepID=A0A934ICJ6_9MICO|nr:type IV pilus assembly protein PilM [Sanguibacter suaedae]MBI9115356.1 type IV pilus assembly protein PilM [Sanguibacter suaedae]